MNFKKCLFALLIISVFLLSSCEVYKTIYGAPSAKPMQKAEPTQVERVEGANAKDPASLEKELYASSDSTKHDPFKTGENALGPFPKGKSLGFTLQKWLSASGIGIYSADADNATLELSFKNLVPNGVYTVLCSRIISSPEMKIEDAPCGAEDGSQNSFTSDSKGLGSFSLAMKLLQATNETTPLVAVAYHSDGKTYGASSGDFGLNTHVQLFFMMPKNGNETKFEVPIKFTNHIDAGMPEQDVFVEKELPPPVVQNETPKTEVKEENPNTMQEPAKTEEPAPTGAATAEGKNAQVVEQKTEAPSENPKAKPVVVVVQETDKVSLAPKAEDPDKNTNLLFTFTSPLNDKGEWQTNYGDAGQYTVTITVSDGEATSSRDALIIVNKKEEPPKIDSSKPIESGLSIDENQAVDFSISASDLNKDQLTYSWKLDGNEAGNADKYTLQTDYDSSGTHTVKADVSDGVSTASKIWSIDVKNVNRPPVLEKVSDVNAKETDKIVVTALAADADKDTITYSISDKRFAQDGNAFTWQTDYDSAGTYDVTLSASDGKDTVSQSFKVTVDNVNRPPVIVDIEQKK